MVLVWLIVVVSGIYGLHRLLSWLEDRGSIYYLKKRGSSGTVGSAFLEVQSLIEPSKRHVVVELARPAVDDQESGDPPAAKE